MNEEKVIAETRKHIQRVQEILANFRKRLEARGLHHDATKLTDSELPFFVEFTPKLKSTTYGSEEYKGFLDALKPALDHHYANNRHHPEHFKNGMIEMNLLDIVEMFCDWLAATERHADGDIFKSIVHNKGRFGYGDELESIFKNTAEHLHRTNPSFNRT